MASVHDLPSTVRRAASGDAVAQARLVTDFSALARATAVRLVDDPAAVDDVVQEAFVEVFAALAQLRHPKAFPAWVRLAVRKHADRHRRTRRPTAPLDGVDPSSARSHHDDELVDQRETARQVRAALAGLRADDRHLLELRYLADWSVAELAEALGITDGAVRKRLHDARRRARPTFRPHLEQEQPQMTDYESHLGRVYAPGELPLPPVPGAVARPTDREPLATGLKVIDTIAPLARGGTVELVGPAGTGHLVLVLELSYRLNRGDRESAIVAVGSTAPSGGARSNLAKLVTEVDEHDRHAVIECPEGGDAVRAIDDGRRLAHGLAASGLDVLLVVDRAIADVVGPAGGLKDLAGLSAGGGSVLLVLLDAYERGRALPADAGMDTRLVFSFEQVALGIYPALDPEASRGHFGDPELAAEVRRVLAASKELRHFFAQPMFMAETYTGVTATWVDREEGERELAGLLGKS
jgi:RNA polymerase sigma-70 factor, ECF subfamily